MEEDMKQLSLRLYQTLETIGASEEMRKVHNENVVGEIIQGWISTLYNDTHVSTHLCGSWCEGTTTPGMGSDVDTLLVKDDIRVIDDIREAGCGLSLLMIQDPDTQPGYYKLQMVLYGIPLTVDQAEVPPEFVADRRGRICYKQPDALPGYEKHGPADTNDTGGELMSDRVFALRCARIPDQYTEWICRKRLHDWPSKSLLDKMAKLSCLVVGVGHEKSEEREMEWRLSFSLQERELMLNLNPVQHKCYVLMKMIKKDIIQPSLDGVDAVSSYHCKTCLFYAVECSPPDIWTPENLVPCLFLCLYVLFKNVSCGTCPNYFISDSNMFDRDVFKSSRVHILRSLGEILRLGYRVLFQLQTDNVGDLLAQRTTFNGEKTDEYRRSFIVHSTMYPLLWTHVLLSTIHSQESVDQTIQLLIKLLDFIRNTSAVRDHTENQTQEAFSYLTPWVHQRLAMSLASMALKTSSNQASGLLLSRSDKHFRLGLETDLMNTRLMYVAVLYKLGMNKECMEILERIELDLSNCVVSACVCNTGLWARKNVHLASKFRDENLSIKETLHSAIASCITFLPSDINIVPPPLQFEMYRAGYPPSASRDHLKECWLDWAVVDAKVFLFFMQYLVYSKLELNTQKDEAILNFERVLSDDIHHPETGYNLLGWISYQENRLIEADMYWKTSLAIRPVHSAVKQYVSSLPFKTIISLFTQLVHKKVNSIFSNLCRLATDWRFMLLICTPLIAYMYL